MPGRQRPTIAITISPELLDRVDKLAALTELSRSRCIERLLNAAMETVEELEGVGRWSTPTLMLEIKERFRASMTQRNLFDR